MGLGFLLLAGCHLVLGLQGADGLRDGADECAAYCADIAAVCTGNQLQYAGNDCLSFCAELERRDPDVLGCRRGALQDFDADGCSTAGPMGVGGDVPACEESEDPDREQPCDLYCDLMLSVCPDTSLEANRQVTAANRAACMAVCEELPPAGSDFAVTQSSLLTGNHLNCRIHHINVALRSPEGEQLRLDHCLHAAGQTGRYQVMNSPCQDND